MDIGRKLKEARQHANLNQEQVAEALGVSRQTISNWENEKTYPDIVSVIKLSDLYSVSLDKLLKEEIAVSNYLEYLEESTNVVKSKTKLSKIVLLCTYFVIWGVAMIAFWFFTSGSDAMGYSIVYLWFLLPVTTFVLSIIIGIHQYWGKYGWLSALFFGIMYMLAEYGTFTMANMVEVHIFRLPEFSMILSGAVVSLIGLGIGTAVSYFKRKNKS